VAWAYVDSSGVWHHSRTLEEGLQATNNDQPHPNLFRIPLTKRPGLPFAPTSRWVVVVVFDCGLVGMTGSVKFSMSQRFGWMPDTNAVAWIKREGETMCQRCLKMPWPG
jgi:hypothetical protein